MQCYEIRSSQSENFDNFDVQVCNIYCPCHDSDDKNSCWCGLSDDFSSSMSESSYAEEDVFNSLYLMASHKDKMRAPSYKDYQSCVDSSSSSSCERCNGKIVFECHAAITPLMRSCRHGVTSSRLGGLLPSDSTGDLTTMMKIARCKKNRRRTDSQEFA